MVGGGRLPQLPSLVSSFWREVEGTSFPYPERNSHPPLHNGLARLTRSFYRSAGEDGQRIEERADRNLQGYSYEVGDRSGCSLGTTTHMIMSATVT